MKLMKQNVKAFFFLERFGTDRINVWYVLPAFPWIPLDPIDHPRRKAAKPAQWSLVHCERLRQLPNAAEGWIVLMVSNVSVLKKWAQKRLF